jgi:hypothetical protein
MIREAVLEVLVGASLGDVGIDGGPHGFSERLAIGACDHL